MIRQGFQKKTISWRVPDNWPELGSGPRGHFSCQRLTGVLSADLSCRLVKPCLDTILPIFLEVLVLDNVVMFRSHGLLINYPPL